MARQAEHARTLGRRGEDAAVAYLEQHGCTVLDRNWRSREGELDIIGTDGRVLVVCEVKTRSGVGFGTPAESITRDKMIRIRRLALKWLSVKRVRYVSVRFDVVGVLILPGQQPLVQHIPGAF